MLLHVGRSQHPVRGNSVIIVARVAAVDSRIVHVAYNVSRVYTREELHVTLRVADVVREFLLSSKEYRESLN